MHVVNSAVLVKWEVSLQVETETEKQMVQGLYSVIQIFLFSFFATFTFNFYIKPNLRLICYFVFKMEKPIADYRGPKGKWKNDDPAGDFWKAAIILIKVRWMDDYSQFWFSEPLSKTCSRDCHMRCHSTIVFLKESRKIVWLTAINAGNAVFVESAADFQQCSGNLSRDWNQIHKAVCYLILRNTDARFIM